MKGKSNHQMDLHASHAQTILELKITILNVDQTNVTLIKFCRKMEFVEHASPVKFLTQWVEVVLSKNQPQPLSHGQFHRHLCLLNQYLSDHQLPFWQNVI